MDPGRCDLEDFISPCKILGAGSIRSVSEWEN